MPLCSLFSILRTRHSIRIITNSVNGDISQHFPSIYFASSILDSLYSLITSNCKCKHLSEQGFTFKSVYGCGLWFKRKPFLLSTKSKFRQNLNLISSKFRCFDSPKCRIRCRNRNFDFDIRIVIPIQI
jgi:hypothetical protein